MQNEALKEVLDERLGQGNSGSGRRSCRPSYVCLVVVWQPRPVHPHGATFSPGSVQCDNSSIHLLLCRLGPDVLSPVLKMSLSLDRLLQKMAPLLPAACAHATEGSQKNVPGMASFTADGRARPWDLVLPSPAVLIQGL